MKEPIKVQVMDDSVRDRLVTAHFVESDRLRALGDYRMVQRTHAIQEVRLSTQSIRVAFDPESNTLYLNETMDGGYVLMEAERAFRFGEPAPSIAEWLRQVFGREEQAKREAGRQEQRAREANQRQARFASVVAEAVERLKSRKPGVRRRAKRLLAKLGK